MTETAVVAFTTFFATIGPLDVGAVLVITLAALAVQFMFDGIVQSGLLQGVTS